MCLSLYACKPLRRVATLAAPLLMDARGMSNANGIEVWRRVHQKYSPSTPGAALRDVMGATSTAGVDREDQGTAGTNECLQTGPMGRVVRKDACRCSGGAFGTSRARASTRAPHVMGSGTKSEARRVSSDGESDHYAFAHGAAEALGLAAAMVDLG